VVSLVANWRITEANNVAREALRQERLRAEEAERRFTQARQAVDLLIDVSEKELADNPPAQGLRKRLLETALVYYQGFISERRGDPSSQAELIAVRERLTKILDDLTVLEGAGELALLSEPSIQQDLGLTEAQRARIQVVTQQFAQSRLDSIRDFHQISAADRRARFLQWARSSEEAVQQTLTEAQLARLRQIGLQLQGPMAFSRPEVVSSLRLSDAQRQTIRQIETEGMAAGWDYMHSETRQPPPAEFHKQVRQQCMQRILAALTPEQLSRWNELTGEKMRDAPDMPPPPEFFPPPEKPGP